MFYLKKLPNGTHVLNREGQKLINQLYNPPKQHGFKNIQQWLSTTNQRLKSH